MSIDTYYRMTIVCEADAEKTEGLCCCAHDEFQRDASESSLQDFCDDAVKYFEGRGWRMMGQVCPKCIWKQQSKRKRRQATSR